jgi:hypothetical protein
MDRFEKIASALVLAGLIGVLCHTHRRRGHNGNLTGIRMNQSAGPCDNDYGPAYLLSALPSFRRKDDYADPVSYWPVLGTPYHTDDGWREPS